MRLRLIVFGFLVSSFVASIVASAGILYGVTGQVVFRATPSGLLGILGLWLATIVGTMLPGFLAIRIALQRGIRSLWFYLFSGAGAGLFAMLMVFFVVLPFDPHALGRLFSYFVTLSIVAGMIGGFAAFLAASVVAGIVITIGVLLREWDDVTAIADPHVAWWMAAFFAFIVAAAGFVPAFLVIAFAEGYRVRSVLFYAATFGLGLVALYYGFGFATHGLPAGREVEIMAGAGIAAGFVYWLVAGRNAGRWREAPAPPTV
jgi:hypothetical protein